MNRILICAVTLGFSCAWAGTTGSIAGTITDPTGSAIPGVAVTVTNIAQGIQTKVIADARGAYTFPSLTVGRYDLKTDAQGFKPQVRSGLAVDLDSALQIDLKLELAEKVDSVTVTADDVHVETASTQVGEVVTSRQMTTVALNGRSYT